MNYELQYEKLINRAKDRKINGYTESHHIIPRCMNGTDDKDNLVDLTAREHFIAHLLLLKIYPKQYSLIKALNMMCVGHREHRSMNRMYGWLREKFSKEMSLSQSGEKNSQHGTIWIHNLDLKESKKIPKGDVIPEGWLKGRKMNFDLVSIKKDTKESYNEKRRVKKLQNFILSEECKMNRINDKIDYKNYVINLYYIFKSGDYNSVRDFHRKYKPNCSVMTLSNIWRKNIKEYKTNSTSNYKSKGEWQNG